MSAPMTDEELARMEAVDGWHDDGRGDDWWCYGDSCRICALLAEVRARRSEAKPTHPPSWIGIDGRVTPLTPTLPPAEPTEARLRAALERVAMGALYPPYLEKYAEDSYAHGIAIAREALYHRLDCRWIFSSGVCCEDYRRALASPPSREPAR